MVDVAVPTLYLIYTKVGGGGCRIYSNNFQSEIASKFHK